MTEPKTAFKLLAPACFPLLVLTLLPVAGVLILAFVDWGVHGFAGFAGLANFATLLEDRSFFNALLVTMIFFLSATVAEVGLGVVAAVALEGMNRGKNVLRTVLAAPLLLSPAIVGIVWKLGLNEQGGLFAAALRTLLGQEIRPLSSPLGAVLTITAIDVWQWTPFVFLLVSFSLEQHKLRYGDLVAIDGLNRFPAARNVWMPLLLPSIGITVVFRTIDCIKVFDIVQTATAGGPGGASEVLSFYAYKQLIKFGNLGYAAAISVVLLALATFVWLVGSKALLRAWEPAK